VCRKKSTRSARLDEIRLLKEPAQAGKVQAVVRMLTGFVVVTEPDNGSKVVRAERVAAPGQSLKIIFDHF
jgi:phage terminase large subunit-like protein